jgi:hypothetical protein
MISTKRICIKKKLPFDSDYIENQFKNLNYDVLRWAVVDFDEENFIIDASVVIE